MDRLPVVLPRSVREQRSFAARRCPGRPELQPPGLLGTAPAVHALLPDLQAEAEARLVPRRIAGPVPAMPLAGVPTVLAALSVVWTERAACGNIRSQAPRTKI